MMMMMIIIIIIIIMMMIIIIIIVDSNIDRYMLLCNFKDKIKISLLI